MTIEQLRERLAAIFTKPYDPEGAHADADDLLIEYIADAEVKRIYDQATLWYA